MLRTALTSLLILFGFSANAQTFDTSAGPVQVDRVVTGLSNPWSVAFLPNFAESGAMLITERGGTLRLATNGGLSAPITGVPEVRASGQGGLLDVVLSPDFASSGVLYLSYAAPTSGGSQTRVAKAVFDQEALALEDLSVIFRQEPAQSTNRHYGGRIVIADDGSLFITIGDRGERDRAQDPTRHQGGIMRILPDGSAHPDNPFIDSARGWRAEIYSFGHRNPQGAALDADGTLWTTEHGAAGGDEVNRPQVGANYGWPVISYGRHYSGAKIGVGVKADGLEQPVHFWDPSIAPSGLTVYDGYLFPEWRGDLIAGALKYRLLARLDIENGRVVGEERLFEDEFGRVRDVRTGPDGAIWFVTEGRNGSVHRITPAQ